MKRDGGSMTCPATWGVLGPKSKTLSSPGSSSGTRRTRLILFIRRICFSRCSSPQPQCAAAATSRSSDDIVALRKELRQLSDQVRSLIISPPRPQGPQENGSRVSRPPQDRRAEPFNSGPPPIQCQLCGRVGHGARTYRSRPFNY
ncbi:hypothetical protein PoB_006269500 [Plakobranchus ocellatus]|uniref:CCHC-type domain-containing protein n=1 Tax=Plakobranchus ocellatus TaxID=259542 RepID=A0AAV4CWE1_9GAST|nr:hypothetical protein PoB_006269500 [Plakobranchus ocellatus]